MITYTQNVHQFIGDSPEWKPISFIKTSDVSERLGGAGDILEPSLVLAINAGTHSVHAGRERIVHQLL